MTPAKKTFIVRKPKMPVNPHFVTRRLADSVEEETDNSGCLCFLLGFTLGPLGLLIAAVVGKSKGLMSALRGLAAAWLLGTFIAIAAYLLDRM